MATVWDHLSVEELEERFVGCEDASASRHFQVIWLLARGHTISQVSGTTAYGERWIEQLLARYNAEGPEALGDLRRRNGAPATILKPDLLAKLRLRLDDPPPDGGLWSSRKVAAWMAGELNLTSVAPQRGWDASKAIGDDAEAPSKNRNRPRPKKRRRLKKPTNAFAEEAAKHPGKPIEVFATDEHRIGLKPITRRVGAPLGERPIAHGHHRFDWLYVTAFCITGHRRDLLVCFQRRVEGILRGFARNLCARGRSGLEPHHLARARQCGMAWASQSQIPDGVRLIYLPPYSPELQPAETLWALVDEPIVNQHIATITDLDEKIAAQCIALSEQREQIQSRTGFHWWPKRIAPN